MVAVAGEVFVVIVIKNAGTGIGGGTSGGCSGGDSNNVIIGGAGGVGPKQHFA